MTRIQPGKNSTRETSSYAPPAEFWQTFISEHWEKSPTTFRYPGREPLLTADEALEIFRGLADQFRNGRQADIDLYVESGLVRSGIGAILPQADDASLDEYIRRAQGQLGDRGMTLVTNSVRRQSHKQHRRATEFARDLLAHIGPGAGNLGSDLFLSTAVRTAFGVHRDPASNFSYIVSGRKRMLVWPQEALAHRTDLRCDGPLKNVFLDQLDLAPIREQAIVLEGGPGEMLYWPASYWHVAESTGQPSLVFNLPIYLYAANYRMAIEFYERKLLELERRGD